MTGHGAATEAREAYADLLATGSPFPRRSPRQAAVASLLEALADTQPVADRTQVYFYAPIAEQAVEQWLATWSDYAAFMRSATNQLGPSIPRADTGTLVDAALETEGFRMLRASSAFAHLSVALMLVGGLLSLQSSIASFLVTSLGALVFCLLMFWLWAVNRVRLVHPVFSLLGMLLAAVWLLLGAGGLVLL